MKARLKALLPLLGYGAFYLVVFFFACYLTFPYSKLRDRIVAEFVAEQQAKGGGQHLEIEELEPYWFTGVKARGVKLTMGAAAKPGTTAEPPSTLEIEELRAKLSILARVFGKTKVSFFARVFGGEIEGTFSDSSTERHVDFELHDLLVGRVEPLQGLVGLPVRGAMTGKVDLTFDDKRASKAVGSINITIAELSVGDGVTKIKGSLALPKIDVGELTLDAEAKDGLLKLNKLAGKGKDLELAADGTVKLRDVPTESSADVYLRFKFTDAYRSRNEVTKTLLGAPGSTAPALFELADPKIKQAKRTDGFYGWHMMGLLSNLKFEPYSGTPPANRMTPPTAPPLRGFGK
jgi:type II secretion system protein N